MYAEDKEQPIPLNKDSEKMTGNPNQSCCPPAHFPRDTVVLPVLRDTSYPLQPLSPTWCQSELPSFSLVPLPWVVVRWAHDSISYPTLLATVIGPKMGAEPRHAN